jgi:hypothetical protein
MLSLSCVAIIILLLICKNNLRVNKKWTPYLIIIVLAIVLFFIRRNQTQDTTKAKSDTNTDKKEGSSTVNRNRGFDRRVSYLEYTEHAKCRMQCRKITQAEVEQIMKQGKINYTKSDVNDKPCPTYALEGVTSDDQRVRIVFAQCDFKTKVVTSIDLDTDWQCHCPGDDDKPASKKKNKN